MDIGRTRRTAGPFAFRTFAMMKILMVCLGNICRSPMAEGIIRHLARERGIAIETDSAGTGNYHVGEAPDRRARAAMLRHGMDISDLRARQFIAEDFDRSDLIFAMDEDNLRNMRRLAPDQARAKKAVLMLDHLGGSLKEVPDPYYGSDKDFDEVFTLLNEACTKILDDVEG